MIHRIFLIGLPNGPELLILSVLAMAVLLAIILVGRSAFMKKFFGVIFLLFGLGLIGLGIAGFTEAKTRSNSMEGQVGETFSDNYRSQNEQQRTMSLAMIVGGGFFFILGLIMVSTRSASQLRKEGELKALRKLQGVSPSSQSPQAQPETETGPFNADIFDQIKKLGELKEKGLLTQEEFDIQKTKLLK